MHMNAYTQYMEEYPQIQRVNAMRMDAYGFLWKSTLPYRGNV